MASRQQGRPIEILLVEDNPGDIRLTQEALGGNKVRNNMAVVQDGAEAMAFLRREAQYADSPRPDLILLDLNLPRIDGREVLRRIKNDNELRLIPVVILTTSREEQDVLKAYGLYANCYVAKPVELEQFMEIVRAIESFWLTVVTLPEGKAA